MDRWDGGWEGGQVRLLGRQCNGGQIHHARGGSILYESMHKVIVMGVVNHPNLGICLHGHTFCQMN